MGYFSAIPVRVNGTQVDAGWWNILRLAGLTVEGSLQDQIDAILAQKGANDGIASLDSGGHIPTSQLPASIIGGLNFQGALDASAGVYPSSPAKGYYYVVNVAGTISGTAYNIGDWATYDGTAWDKVDNAQVIVSVAGRTGVIVLTKADVGLSNVDNTSDSIKNAAPATLTNKTFGDAPTFTEISTPSNPATGEMKLYPKSDGKFYSLDEFGAEKKLGSGGGSGGSKNYLTDYLGNPGNGDLELGLTNGWSLFNTTLSGVNPTGAVSAGASSIPIFTATSVTPSPIAGSYSLNVGAIAAINAGDGHISDAFTIDKADQAKLMTIKFSYEVFAGLSAMDFSGTTSNTWAVWIYDVTNSQWIQPTGCYGIVQGSGVGFYKGTFQTTSNSTHYRLAVICVNSTSGAASMVYDEFSVGPDQSSEGAAITDWVPYTPLFVGMGAVSGIGIEWRQLGDSIQLRGPFTTGSAPSAVLATMTLPNNLKTPADVDTYELVGTLGSGNSAPAAFTVLAEPNSNVIYFGIQSNTTNGLTAQNGSTLFAGSVKYGLIAEIPIQGYSSNVQMSSDADTRIVAASAYFSGAPSWTSGSPGNFDIIGYDTHGAITTGASWKYTCPVPGYYRVTVGIAYSSGAVSFILYRNGTGEKYLCSTLSSVASYHVSGSATILCKTGDYLQIVPTASGTGDNNPPVDNSIFVERVSGPSVIAASESVNMCVTLANAVTTSGNVNYDTVVFDSHGLYNAASGIYTVPMSGKFRISVIGSTTSAVNILVAKNGTPINFISSFSSTAVTSGSVTLPFVAGDVISIQPSASATFQATSPSCNTFSIERIGN